MAVIPVPAATVMLLRDGSASPEVLLVQRNVKSEFLPDLYVFPGGRVEDEDLALADRLAGLASEDARRCAASAQDRAHGYIVAAIRETFEEVGLLLARRRGDAALVGGDLVERLDRHRLDVQAGRASFADLVRGEDLELAADQLALHGHWITPEMVPHRFDTLFFCALAPSDQVAAHDGLESTAHAWLAPEEALEQARRGERSVVFPTRCNLETLRGFPTAATALEASRRRPVLPVQPRVEQHEGGPRLVIRADTGYATTWEQLPARPR